SLWPARVLRRRLAQQLDPAGSRAAERGEPLPEDFRACIRCRCHACSITSGEVRSHQTATYDPSLALTASTADRFPPVFQVHSPMRRESTCILKWLLPPPGTPGRAWSSCITMRDCSRPICPLSCMFETDPSSF